MQNREAMLQKNQANDCKKLPCSQSNRGLSSCDVPHAHPNASVCWKWPWLSRCFSGCHEKIPRAIVHVVGNHHIYTHIIPSDTITLTNPKSKPYQTCFQCLGFLMSVSPGLPQFALRSQCSQDWRKWKPLRARASNSPSVVNVP